MKGLHFLWASALASLLCIPLGAQGAFAARCQSPQGAQGPLRILHFGDSHLAAPATQHSYRAYFQSLFGDGGPGFGLPWVHSMPGVKAGKDRLWTAASAKPAAASDRSLGLSAGSMQGQNGAQAWLEARFCRLRLHGLRGFEGGSVQVKVDGVLVGTLDLAGMEGTALFDRELSSRPQTHRVELRCQGRACLLGVDLENRWGVAYSPVAFNGARAVWMGGMAEAVFESQARLESPDLVILSFGTNEANVPCLEVGSYRSSLEGLLARFRQAAPRADFLLVGPPDGRLPKGSEACLDQVIAIQKQAAARFGGRFVDQRASMGGSGAIQTWIAQGLAGGDGVHMKPPGYLKLAQASLGEYMRAWGKAGPSDALLAMPGEASSPVVHESAPRSESASRPIYTFRFPDGRVLVTDNPDAKGSDGTLISRIH